MKCGEERVKPNNTKQSGREEDDTLSRERGVSGLASRAGTGCERKPLQRRPEGRNSPIKRESPRTAAQLRGPIARLTPENSESCCRAINVLRDTCQLGSTDPATAEPSDVAGNYREAAPHTSTMPFAERGKDGTRGTGTSAIEEADAPHSHA
ncbi:hypothetical protein NDU88_006439 [Pleurodeles waltl]|uniref:Uncharacterized protein n=1 Tax=Pleurodeles waltl TaxID=8319 RepID=A0AAV7TDI4_PLEWA|nr:hypothetical protein NDU88_006439 [Pleurodeles waltl]